jgi:hypothetical protein
MCLKDHCPSTNDFPSLAPGVARRADLLPPDDGEGTSCPSAAVLAREPLAWSHRHRSPTTTHLFGQTSLKAEGNGLRAGQSDLERASEAPPDFLDREQPETETALSDEARRFRPKSAMKDEAKASKSFVKRKPLRFARQNVANEHNGKIDQIIVRHPRARAKRTCSWIVFSMEVSVSMCANTAPSPIQVGMAGEGEGWVWMVTVGGAVSCIEESAWPHLFASRTEQEFCRSHQTMRSLELAQCLPHLLQQALLLRFAELPHHTGGQPACGRLQERIERSVMGLKGKSTSDDPGKACFREFPLKDARI